MNSALSNSTFFGFYERFAGFLIVLRSTLFIHFLLGFSLNCYIIFLLLPRVGEVDVSVVFALNQAASEILFSISSFLFILALDNRDNSVVGLLEFLFGTSMSTRLLFLCCVCLERYLAVVHPVTFLRLKPLRYRLACSVVVWICSLVLGTAVCMWIDFAFKLLSAVYLIVLAVEFFCCVSILRRLRHPWPRHMGREQGEMNAAKKKAFQIVFINLLTCLTQNTPVAITYCLENIVSDYDYYLALDISSVINTFTGFVQPVFILQKAGKLSFIRCS